MSIVQLDASDGCVGFEINASHDEKLEESGLRQIDTSSRGNLESNSMKSKLDDSFSSAEQLNALPHIWDESAERKLYTEREIAYNLLLRKLVDEFLDRTVTYSHQPKQLLNTLRSVLERNFPEISDSSHCERICAYLKACRRNAKKKRGEPLVRMSARYLSAGMATRMAEQMYVREREVLCKSFAMYSQYSDASQSSPPDNVNKRTVPNAPASVQSSQPSARADVATGCKMLENMSNKAEQSALYCNLEQVKNQEPGIAELMMAKMLTQTAEFLLLTANRIEGGHSLFPDSNIHLDVSQCGGYY